MEYHVEKNGRTVVCQINAISIFMGIFVKKEYRLRDARQLDIFIKFNELSRVDEDDSLLDRSGRENCCLLSVREKKCAPLSCAT